MISRREVLVLSAGVLAAAKLSSVAVAQDAERHGISAFGDLAYPPDFKQFAYVNPDAPKGGTWSEWRRAAATTDRSSRSIR